MTIPIRQLVTVEVGALVALYDDGEEVTVRPVLALAARAAHVSAVVLSGGDLALAGVEGSDPDSGDFLGLHTPREAATRKSDIEFNRETAR